MGQESGQNGGADSMAFLSDANFSEIVLNYSSNTAEVETGGVRVNMLPREGGNSFSGMFLTNLSDPSLQANNIDTDLVSRGLPANSANRVSKMWRVSTTLGGPIMRDKVWFFGAHSSNRTDSFANGIFPDSVQGDLDYTPTRNDPKSQSVDDQIMRSHAGRLTYQATSKDKFGFFIDRTNQRRAHFFIGGQAGRIGEEGSIDRGIKSLLSQVTWTRPATNRLLFEAGFGIYRHDSVSGNVSTVPDGAIPALQVGSTGGTATVDDSGAPVFDYPLTPYLFAGFKQALLRMAEAQFAAGATRVMPAHMDGEWTTSWAACRTHIEALAYKPIRLSLATAHIMGGCAMGEDPKRSVARSDGSHHQLENLTINDGSLFPTSIGANPQLSIYALAARNATALAARLKPAAA